jgi:hypothetical protein
VLGLDEPAASVQAGPPTVDAQRLAEMSEAEVGDLLMQAIERLN